MKTTIETRAILYFYDNSGTNKFKVTIKWYIGNNSFFRVFKGSENVYTGSSFSECLEFCTGLYN